LLLATEAELKFMDYMTAQQAAEKWGVSLRWVQTYLKNGRIDGAIRFGRAWMIPKDTEKPVDGRLKNTGKEDNHGAENTDN
jgi:excisionase family DNA binding protein